MKVTIDAAGRLVIPKPIRQAAGLRPGMPLDVRWQDGRIEIEPAPLAVKFVRDGPLLVAVPEGEVEPLTADEVEATRQALIDDRGFGV
jgi:AbrB family looped-hinge helix DNA binding protein